MQENKQRWTLGSNRIHWDVLQDSKLLHEDHLEMSGKKVSMIVRYGINQEGKLILSRKVVWPTLRTIPNDTHASMMHDFELEMMPIIQINGKKSENERPRLFQFNGLLHIYSVEENGIFIERTIFPSTDTKSALEKIVLTNTSNQFVSIEVISRRAKTTVKGVSGIYLIDVTHDAHGERTLGPNESLQFGVRIHAKHLKEPDEEINVTEEQMKRCLFVDELKESLHLETPNPDLNRMFEFAKLRTAESIFETKGGLMHSPGGGHYYAGIWTNDQIEYAGPLFPYLGNELGNEATLNALRLYTSFMGPDYQPIPSSIIAEGVDIWEGAGDRGDAAMYAYGASLFALATGNQEIAKELWPAIEWCLNYCERQKNSEGVIASDSDELEGRFPSGSANLSTSCLTYAAYLHAADLARALGKSEYAELYKVSAGELYEAIEEFFGATVEGFDTYRYYDGNDILRSWICIPLTMGIEKRKVETIKALLSPRLWSEDGLATQAGDTTFWDRSTLYGLRGMFAAGETEIAIAYLESYSSRRLLGEHVPYAVEAYPEGNQRHLSAESALYCRVITEGLFGIKPTGLNSFACVPRLPEGWDEMALRSIKAFGREFDLVVKSQSTHIELIVSSEKGNMHFEGVRGTAFEVQWCEF
ncbi:hypothetical protein GC102_13035 [Paenibacillus sp. LMG 31460]|uniref:Glycosyl hydrolase 36 catalytic domain-containing protein n=1 Tax=Paenibacillus germinis TaxID=2654979 RepID=A0ABX1Z0B7_9BACL|nr:hypothetical protein [Paenibacillus germinis]NOU86692.1 hypothetical protein [Paenibacillus germinis]